MYAQLCGWSLAKAHARSGDAIAIASYLGGSDTFDRALASFAESYADQNERDYRAVEEAVASGRLVAETGVGATQASATRGVLAGVSARWASSATGGDSRLRRIHLPDSTTSGRSAASPRHASHCLPVSETVSSPACRPGSSVASTISTTGTSEIASALRIGGGQPAGRVAAVGQRVEDGAEAHDDERHRHRGRGLVGARVVRAGDQRDERREEQRRRVEDPEPDRASVGDRHLRVARRPVHDVGRPGSTAMTTTPAAVTKNSR